MEKSFKFLLILLTLFVFIGSLNMVSASDISSEAVLDDSSLSSESSEDIVSVNDNIIYVSNSGSDEFGDGSVDSPYGSLSQAINKSANGSVICLNGSFSGEKNSNLTIDKNLSIISLNISYINGNSTSRLFNVLEGCTFLISNLSITSFDVSDLNSNGGAIYSEGNLVIINSEFNNCVANNGGAIYSRGFLFVNNSKFYQNRAFAYGGAIYNLGNMSFVNNSVFKENCAKSATTEVSGGAISNYGVNVIVSYCLFDSNYAKETSKVKNDPIYGGAISNYGAGFYVYDCDFLNNYVEVRTDAGSGEVCLNTADGGAIYTIGYAKIENSRFNNDTAHCKYSSNQVNIYGNKCYGGAISIGKGEGFYLLNCTFVNCSAANGVVKNYANNAVFENNTFDNGKALFRGSAIYDHGENDIYRGNIFSNNNDNKNSAQGTVYVDACNVTFENNTFLDNYDTSGSGHASNNAAIYIYNPTFRGGSDARETNIKISNNNFDGNDKGIYLYCAEGAVISNNSFTNQKGQAIDTYVGGYLQILDNYFENNHGYHGAVDINSHDTIIRGNTFVNNTGGVGGGIGLLCRENVTIDSNIFINNHATYGGGADIYSLYGGMSVTNNEFVFNPIYDNESSIYTYYSSIEAISNTFTVLDNLHKLINQIGQIESYLDNIIYDNTPVNNDGTITNSSVENLVDLKERSQDDFTYYRNATERHDVELEDDSDSNSKSSDINSGSYLIEDIIEDIIEDVVDDVTNGAGDGSSNGTSTSSGGKVDSIGYNTNSSSDVGKYQEVNRDQSDETNPQKSPASSNNPSSQESSRATAYDLSEKNQGIASQSVNQFVILIVIFVILLIYGFYRGRKDI